MSGESLWKFRLGYSRSSSTQRGYGRRWGKARAAFLCRFPLCRMCFQEGKVVEATVVDHIKPHKGNDKLFWNEDNWQSLCSSCHSGAKQQQEATGVLRGCSEDGLPLDGGHPWNDPGGGLQK